MVHDRERLALGLEALHDGFVVHAGLDQLQRHGPPYGGGLLGEPNLTHASFAELALEVEALGNSLTRRQADGAESLRVDSKNFGQRRAQELGAELIADPDQRFELGAQCRVGTTGLIEKSPRCAGASSIA